MSICVKENLIMLDSSGITWTYEETRWLKLLRKSQKWGRKKQEDNTKECDDTFLVESDSDHSGFTSDLGTDDLEFQEESYFQQMNSSEPRRRSTRKKKFSNFIQTFPNSWNGHINFASKIYQQFFC